MFDEVRINEILLETENLELMTRQRLLPETAKVLGAAKKVAESWSGSSTGHHASIYYDRFRRPPSNHGFNTEWGTIMGMPKGWVTYTVDEVVQEIASISGVSLESWQSDWESTLLKFDSFQKWMLTEILVIRGEDRERTEDLVKAIEMLEFSNSVRKRYAINILNATKLRMSRDLRALSSSGVMIPGHVFYQSLAEEVEWVLGQAAKLVDLSRRLLRSLTLLEESRAIVLEKKELMSLQDMTNNPFLLNRHGQGTPFRGLLTRGLIVTFDSDLPVESGDLVERVLPHGRSERYLVVDVGFHSRHGHIGDHYQMQVRRESSIADPTASQSPAISNTFYLQGPNSRVNQHTTDNSQNSVDRREPELFETIRSAIESGVTDTIQKARLLDAISEMERNVGTPAFGDKFQQTVALAANYMTIIAPFLPALGHLTAIALG